MKKLILLVVTGFALLSCESEPVEQPIQLALDPPPEQCNHCPPGWSCVGDSGQCSYDGGRD